MGLVRFGSAVLLGYLLGAIPTGLIVGKVVKGIDLREYGSGKTGATNALRTLGAGPAALVVTGDVLKGVAAVGLARLTGGSTGVQSVAAYAAAIGHNWPVFAQFRGGRGVLVSYSGFYILCWPAGVISSAIGIPVIALSRMVSLGVLVGCGVSVVVACVVVARGSYSPWVLVYSIAGAGLIVLRHRDNIERILAGTERKIGQPALPVA